MKMLKTAMLATAIVCSAVAAHAATITENLVGVISGANTTDTTGIFDKAGANLAGQKIQIYTQYVTNLFTSHANCRTSRPCEHYDSQGNPGTPGSVLTSLTVNGKRVVYSPTYSGQLIFSNYQGSLLYVNTDVYSGFGQGFRGSALSVAFTSPVAFGVPLSPGNGPILDKSTDFVSFFVAASQLPVEELTFSVTSASP